MLDTDEFSKTSKSRPLGDVLHILLLLIISKLLKVVGVFLTNDLLKSYHLILILFLSTLIAAIFLIVIQKPFAPSSYRLNRHHLYRLIKYSICLTVVRLLWFFGLTLCGPLRTILLFEHSDLVILVCSQIIFSSSTGSSNQTSKTRGFVFFILAVLAIFAFDNDDSRQGVDHPEGYAHHRFFAHLFYRLMSLIGVADHKGGVLLLLFALIGRCMLNSSSKKLVLDIGGPKKFYALTTCFSTICFIPLSIVVMFVNNFFPDFDESISTTAAPAVSSSFIANLPSLIIPLVLISVFLFVLDFYVEQVSMVKLDRVRTCQYGTFTLIFGALFASLIWGKSTPSFDDKTIWFNSNNAQEHELSGGVVFAVVMFAFATDLLSRPSRQRSGALIGYGQDGLPVFNQTHQRSQSLIFILKSSLKDILAESDSRQIFYFLCINLVSEREEILRWT